MTRFPTIAKRFFAYFQRASGKSACYFLNSRFFLAQLANFNVWWQISNITYILSFVAYTLFSVAISNKFHPFLIYNNILKFVFINYDKREHTESTEKKNTSIRQSSGAARKYFFFFLAKMKKLNEKRMKKDRRNILGCLIFNHSKVKSDLEFKYSDKLVLQIPVGLGWEMGPAVLCSG